MNGALGDYIFLNPNAGLGTANPNIINNSTIFGATLDNGGVNQTSSSIPLAVGNVSDVSLQHAAISDCQIFTGGQMSGIAYWNNDEFIIAHSRRAISDGDVHHSTITKSKLENGVLTLVNARKVNGLSIIDIASSYPSPLEEPYLFAIASENMSNLGCSVQNSENIGIYSINIGTGQYTKLYHLGYEYNSGRYNISLSKDNTVCVLHMSDNGNGTYGRILHFVYTPSGLGPINFNGGEKEKLNFTRQRADLFQVNPLDANQFYAGFYVTLGSGTEVYRFYEAYNGNITDIGVFQFRSGYGAGRPAITRSNND